ncbi:MAG TPA: hypothetical protein P5121_24030 [Caldilineaceae bacterium]|nr:hypothetical protein [Caldilineaceae bacterium]
MVQTADDYYREADDPAIELLDGPVNLSMHGKAMLREEIKDHSGWTQKLAVVASLRLCDIVLDRRANQYHLLDLADLGQALAIELITPAATTAILQRVDTLLTAITQDEFPFPEIARAQALCRQLGW